MNIKPNEFQIMLFTNNPYTAAVLAILFLPLTLIFFIIISIRHSLYDTGILKSYRSDVFTVSIGNISVGGTGKTPTVISLVNSLAEEGFKILVVTAGFGRKSTGRVVVNENTPVSESGDEPLTIFRKTKAAVVCDKERSSAVKDMASGFDIVVLDDAFQHRKIGKHVDIVLLDESRFLGNRLLLPSGILRDKISRLNHCDLIILSKVKEINSASVRNKLAYLKEFGKMVILSKLAYGFISDGKNKIDISAVKAMNISLFCGIGNPNDFFDIFTDYKIITKKAFSDHCSYSDKECSELAGMKKDADILITTYKDFVKILPETAAELNIRYLDIDLKFYNEKSDQINISDILKGFRLGKK